MERGYIVHDISKSASERERLLRREHPRIRGFFEGGLNKNIVIQLQGARENNDKFLLRYPRSVEDRHLTQHAIQQEYDAVGATGSGISFRFRTIDEQVEFLNRTHLLGLKTLPILDARGDAMLVPYVDGILLHQYIQQEPEFINKQIIQDILCNLQKAHRNDIVFGDRWATNTMITPQGNFVELDFDIELLGEKTTIASFELAQTLYHLLHFSKENRKFIKDNLIDIYKKNPEMLLGYNLTSLRTFIQGQTEYFYNNYQKDFQMYEGIIPQYKESYELIEGLEAISRDYLLGRDVQSQSLMYANLSN